MSCPDCFRGGVSKSHPTGKEITIHSVKTYVAEPDVGVQPKGIIVFITDAFGWRSVNNRVLCDHYAKGGFLVYCPDFMNGRAMSLSIMPIIDKLFEKSSWLHTVFCKWFHALKVMWHVVPWMLTCTPAKTEAEVIKYFKSIRTSTPPFHTANLKVGAAGFCWGGKHTVTLAKDDPNHRVIRHSSQTRASNPEPLIDAAFVAHPTFIKVPDDIEPIKIPISWSVGEEDMQMKGPDIKKMKIILEGKKDTRHNVGIIPRAKHGYAVRFHPEDDEEMAAAEKAEKQALSWFSQWFC